MFSKACEYGLRALTVIAVEGKKGRLIGIKELCEIAQTPVSFTAKILQSLVKRRIISSKKGPTGGFYFSKKLEDISIYSVVEAIDGKEIFDKCGLGLPFCDAENPCPLHEKFLPVRAELHTMCTQNTLEDLVAEFHEGIYSRKNSNKI